MAIRRIGRRKRRRGVEPTVSLLSPQQERAALLLWRNSSLSLEAIAARLGVEIDIVCELVNREL